MLGLLREYTKQFNIIFVQILFLFHFRLIFNFCFDKLSYICLVRERNQKYVNKKNVNILFWIFMMIKLGLNTLILDIACLIVECHTSRIYCRKALADFP